MKSVRPLHKIVVRNSFKNIKEDLNKGRHDIACQYFGRLNIIKLSNFPKLIYRSNYMPAAFITNIF